MLATMRMVDAVCSMATCSSDKPLQLSSQVLTLFMCCSCPVLQRATMCPLVRPTVQSRRQRCVGGQAATSLELSQRSDQHLTPSCCQQVMAAFATAVVQFSSAWV
jgi:hypothetical protein